MLSLRKRLRPRSRVRALAQLRGAAEVRVFVAICALAPLAPFVMRAPLPLLGRWLVRPVGRRRAAAVPPARVAELVALAQMVAHPLVRRGCVTRGVSLLWLLRRQGLPVELAFGLGDPREDPSGHCWLILDDRPFLEPPASAEMFVEIHRLSEQHSR